MMMLLSLKKSERSLAKKLTKEIRKNVGPSITVSSIIFLPFIPIPVGLINHMLKIK